MQITTNNYVQSYQISNNPSFKAINVKQLTSEQVKKITKTAGYGSIIGSAMLLINKSAKDNSNPNTELYAKMQEPNFIADNKAYHKNLMNRHSFISNDNFDMRGLGIKKHSEDVLYSPELSKRIADAALKLVQIPEFANSYDILAEHSNLEVTPENIEIVEKFLNNEDLLNNKSLRQRFAEIISFLNQPDSSEELKMVDDIINEYLQNPNDSRSDLGDYIAEELCLV